MTFQKLVEFCRYAGGQTCTTCGLSLNDMSDSMHERDKLRTELAKTEAFVEVQRTELLYFDEGNAKLRAENERLRAALQQLVEKYDGTDGEHMIDTLVTDLVTLLEAAPQIADGTKEGT